MIIDKNVLITLVINEIIIPTIKARIPEIIRKILL